MHFAKSAIKSGNEQFANKPACGLDSLQTNQFTKNVLTSNSD